MKIYEIMPNGYLGNIVDNETVWPDYTAVSPGDIPPDHFAVWTGTGWRYTDQPAGGLAPLAPLPPPPQTQL